MSEKGKGKGKGKAEAAAAAAAEPGLDDWYIGGTLKRAKDANDNSDENVNTFSEQPAERWTLRSKSYLQDSKKEPSLPSAFELCGISVFRTPEIVYHSAEHVRCLREWLEARPQHEFVVMTWHLPGPPFHSVVQVARRRLPVGEDAAFDKAWDKFKSGDAEYRSSRFKFLPIIPEAPWALRMTVSSLGGERPVILCTKLDSEHFTGKNYVEIDVNVASSRVATMLSALIIRAGANIIVDLGFTVEGQARSELPERVLFNSRWHYCAVDDIAVSLDDEGNIRALNVSSRYLDQLDGDGEGEMDPEKLKAMAEVDEGDGNKTFR